MRHAERHHEPACIGRSPAVETLRVLEQGRVAARAHGLQDLARGALDLAVLGGLEGEQLGERGLEAGVAAGEPARFNHGMPSGTPR